MQKNFICLPRGRQANELLAELIHYLGSNPPDMGAPVQMHVYNYFVNSYPCQAAK